MFYFTLLLTILFIHNIEIEGTFNRIVNGTNAWEGEFPYMVSIRYYNRHNCGGSIINKNYILTAAHCIVKPILSYGSVLFGSVKLHNGEELLNHTRKFKRVIPYPGAIGDNNDVAVIELDAPLEFSPYVQPVLLPEPHTQVPTEINGTLTGWGHNLPWGASVMDTLQKAEVIVFSDQYCNDTYNGIVEPELQCCAGVPEGGKGNCYGDSGGPLIINGLQYGIILRSITPCIIQEAPGILAKVPVYTEWIRNQTGS